MAGYEAYERMNIPKAHGFDVCECGDPNCGPHIVALDPTGKPIVELVLSKKSAVDVIAVFQVMLYGKAVESDR